MNPSHTPQQPSNEAPTSSWGSKVLPVFIVLLLALAGWRLSESDQRISHLEEELTDTTVELETLSDENDRHASALQQSSQLLADLSSKAAHLMWLSRICRLSGSTMPCSGDLPKK